jgi:hypothetical protein
MAHKNGLTITIKSTLIIKTNEQAQIKQANGINNKGSDVSGAAASAMRVGIDLYWA